MDVICSGTTYELIRWTPKAGHILLLAGDENWGWKSGGGLYGLIQILNEMGTDRCPEMNSCKFTQMNKTLTENDAKFYNNGSYFHTSLLSRKSIYKLMAPYALGKDWQQCNYAISS